MGIVNTHGSSDRPMAATAINLLFMLLSILFIGVFFGEEGKNKHK